MTTAIILALACSAPGDLRKESDSGGAEPSVLLQEYYNDALGWCVGVGVYGASIDAGLHVGVDAKFDWPVRAGHNSALATMTVGTGAGDPRALYVERSEATEPWGSAVCSVQDFAEGEATTMSVLNRRGLGSALHVKSSGAREAVLVAEMGWSETDPSATPEGRSLLVHHRGSGIGLSVSNAVGSCTDVYGDVVDCITPDGGVPDGIEERPTGELVEIVDGGANQTLDIYKVGPGNVIGVHKANLPGDTGTMWLMDNRSAEVHYMSAVDGAAGRAYMLLSKTALRLASGVKLGISDAADPGPPLAAVHVQDGDVRIDNGYFRMAVVEYGPPPAEDCTTECVGCRKYDPVYLCDWVCDGAMWRAH